MIIRNIHLLHKLDYLIQCRKTGSPKDLATRFKVSEKCIRIHINVLRQLGAPISFCKKRKSYLYETEGCFCFKFTIADYDETNLK